MTRRIVVLSPTGAVTRDLDLSWAADDRVDLVLPRGAAAPAAVSAHHVDLRLGGVGAAVRRLVWGSAAGRTVFRLTPWDGGRRLWRAVRRDPAISELLRNADLVVAAERDGVFTAWKSVRRTPAQACVYGLPAAAAHAAATEERNRR